MTRHIDNTTRPKHAATQDALEVMIRDLRTTIHANEPIGTVQRQHAVSVIHTARRDVERCSTPFDDLVMRHSIADFSWPDHMALIEWLTGMSMDLIKQGLPDVEAKQIRSKPIDEARFKASENA